jgi:hypothetical protein
VGALQAAWDGPSSYVLLWALLAVRASGRNVDRRQHNEHAEDGVKHDARAVRCPGHDVFPFFQRVCPLVSDIGGRAAPICDLRHTFALLGTPFDLRRLPARVIGRQENNGNHSRRGFCGLGGRGAHRSDHRYRTPNQLRREGWKSIELIGCPPVLDRYVLPRHITCLDQLEECVQMPVKIARSAPRLSFGLPELLVAIHSSRQSCCECSSGIG